MPGPLYSESLAARYRGTGKPYRPSNGSEGAMFEARWCDLCVKDALWRQMQNGSFGCGIYSLALWCRVDEPEYPKEWTHDDQGQPCCTAFEQEAKR